MMKLFLQYIILMLLFVECNPKPKGENEGPKSQTYEVKKNTQFSDYTNGHLQQTQQTFIPIYSTVNFKKNRKYKLAITLRIRNLDAVQSIMIRKIKIMNDGGEVTGFLTEKEVELKPFQATNIFVEEINDSESGFLVEWKGDSLKNLPVMQSVMLGTTDTQGISFVVDGTHLKN